MKLIRTTSILMTLSFFLSCGQSSESKQKEKEKGDEAVRIEEEEKSYEEKVISVEEEELSQPTKFLNAGGTYNENLLGDKLKVHGEISNSATVASFKDAVVRITYFTKTKTVLEQKDFTIYEIFAPNSTINFELKIDNYRDVNSISWEVISAVGI
jgi:hypothetical protein